MENIEDLTIEQRAENIAINFNPVAIKKDNTNAVLVKDENSGMKFWIDVWIDDEYHDVNCDWNQDTFFLLNEDDLLRREIQKSCWAYELASNAATSFLEDQKVIRQDNNGNWFNN